jgi:hypothetical protein
MGCPGSADHRHPDYLLFGAVCWIYPDQPKGASYRAYILNDLGRIFTFAKLEAQGDAEATWQARHLRDGFDIEVQQGAEG